MTSVDVKIWIFSLSNSATAQGGPGPPSRVSSIFPGLGQLFKNTDMAVNKDCCIFNY